MKANTEHTRQMLGCGWLPLPAESLLRFRRVPTPGGYKGEVRTLEDGRVTDQPSVCPGYTTALPEVIEIARARFHAKAGGPRAIGLDDWTDHPLALGIEILEGAANESERWCFDNPVKK